MRGASCPHWVPWLLLAGLACGKVKPSTAARIVDGGADAPDAVARGDGLAPIDGTCGGGFETDAGVCVCGAPSLPDICHNPCFPDPSSDPDCPLISWPYVCVDFRFYPDNCGACGHACAPSSACRDGVCTPPARPFLARVEACEGLRLAAGSGSLFWTDASHGTVMRAPATGGAPVTLATGQEAPTELGLFGDSLYWINRKGARALMKVAVAGGPSTVVATSPASNAPDAGLSSGINAFTVATDGTVYFSSGSTIYVVLASGGTPSAVVQFSAGVPDGLALDGTTLVMASFDYNTFYATPVVPGNVSACGPQFPGIGDPGACIIAESEAPLRSPVFLEAGRLYWWDRDALESASIAPAESGRKITHIYPGITFGNGQLETFTLHGAMAFFALEGGDLLEAPLVEDAAGALLAREPPLPRQPGSGLASKHFFSIAADGVNVFWSTLETDATGKNVACAINTIRR